MKLTASFSKKTSATFIALISIGLIFSIYFFVYIPGNVKFINQQKFRLINRYAQNIELRYSDAVKRNEIDTQVKPDVEDIIKTVVQQNTGYFEGFVVLNANSILYNSFSSNILADSLFNLLQKKSAMGFGNIVESKMSEENYYLFTNPFELDSFHLSKQATPPNKTLDPKINPGKIYICGFVEKGKFNKKAREIKEWILINACILLIIILMSLPFLKLMFMSPLERLYRQNILFLGLSLFVGSGLITLIIISFSSYFLALEKSYQEVKELSKNINEKFKNELNQNLYVLQSIDNSTSQSGESAQNKIQTVNDTIFKRYEVLGSLDTNKMLIVPDILSCGYLPCEYEINFNDLFWVNKTGNLKLRIQSGVKEGPPNIKIDKRKYFSKIIKKDFWKIPNHENEKDLFALESIKSWTADGNYEAGISKPSNTVLVHEEKKDTAIVVAISTMLSSVMNPLLPPGFGFSIIDESGNVWFHSQIEKNTQENFFEEIADSKKIKSCVHGRVAQRSKINYHGKDHTAYVSPIDKLPLFIVTFHDRRYVETPILQATSISFIIFTVSIFIFGILFLLLHILTSKNSNLKIKVFFLGWLLPKEAHNQKYQLLILCNSLLILLVLFHLISYCIPIIGRPEFHNLNMVFSSLFMPIYLLPFTYLLLQFNNPEDGDIASGHSVKLNESRWTSTKKSIQWSKGKYNGWYFIIFTSVIVILLNIGIANRFNCNYWNVLGFQVLLLAVLLSTFLYYIYGLYVQSTGHKFIFPKIISRIPDTYTFSMTTWLILASIVPMLFYFKYSYSIENNIWARYTQLELAKKKDQRDQSIRKLYDNSLYTSTNGRLNKSKEKEAYLERKIANGQYYDFAAYKLKLDTSIHSSNKNFDTEPSSSLDTLIFHYLPTYDNLNNKIRATIFPNSENYKWWWNKSISNDTIPLYYEDFDGNILSITTVLQPLERNFAQIIWLCIFILLMILASNLLIKYARFKIFAQNYRNYKVNNKALTKDYKAGISNPIIPNNRIFLLSMPYSSDESADRSSSNPSNKHAKELLLNFKNIYSKSFLPKIKKKIGKSKVIKIENFEYLTNDHQAWKKKLEILEWLNLYKDKQIIIRSHFHPLDVIAFYDFMIKKTLPRQWEKEQEKKYDEYHRVRSQWKKYFHNYVKLYAPIEDSTLELVGLTGYDAPSITKLVSQELGHGSYLPKLEPQIRRYCNEVFKNDKKVKEDDVIIKIQSLAEPYYYSMWSSLNKEERFFIFDLAKDGFANAYNTNGIKRLLLKGIINYKDGFSIFNKSFNNFILTVVDSEMNEQMQRELSKKGSWNTIKLILALIVISIITFIILGQEQFVNDFNAMVGAIVALAGLLLRFGGSYALTSSKQGF